jgi:hypothetical protein
MSEQGTTKALSICAALVLLSGCGPDPDMPMREQKNNADRVDVSENARIEVTRIGVFRDNLAYDDRRGVYLIVDKQTGQEFIGVSGVGISATGSHSQSCGKTQCQVEDER